MNVLVGYRRFKSKMGNRNFCVMNVVSDASVRDERNGLVGQKVSEVFMPEELTDLLSPSDIGHELELVYECNDGRAYLIDVNVK